MFGHQDNNQDDQQHHDNPAPEPTHNEVLGDDHHTDDVPTVVDDSVTHTDEPVNPALPDDHSSFAPTEPVTPTAAHNDDLLPSPDKHGANDLLDIKQQALKQLTPLVDHLDQSPEEKFRTTMMMIQASDDQSLVKAAYDAAKQITDEKAKAQALLDIVNEINYFTHAQDNQN